jgi:CBS domain-containing protein
VRDALLIHFPEMSESGPTTSGSWWRTPLLHRVARLQQREEQVFLVLALVIGALTGLAVVAFILLTERAGMRLYPPGGAPWRRVLFPVVGSLGIGYLLFRYFPNARGSGVPQTKAALYARGGRITLRTALGKFFCTSATLASGIPLGREGPSVQVGAGIASVLGRRMTSVMIIFEMTQDYAVIVPLMISNLVSLFISSRLQRQPIYQALAVQDGIHLPTAETRQRHGQRQVTRIKRDATELLPSEITVEEALERVRSSEFRTWLVMDRRGVVGVVNLLTLEREQAEGAAKHLEELVNGNVFPHVHPDQGLDLALERMGADQVEVLPVVSRADVHKLEGIVTLRDVLNSYGVGRLNRD